MSYKRKVVTDFFFLQNSIVFYLPDCGVDGDGKGGVGGGDGLSGTGGVWDPPPSR